MSLKVSFFQAIIMLLSQEGIRVEHKRPLIQSLVVVIIFAEIYLLFLYCQHCQFYVIKET